MVHGAADPEVAAFYRGGPNHVWLSEGRPTPAAVRAMARLADARTQGLDETRYLTPDLQQAWAAVQRGDRKPATVRALDLLLSSAFMRFIQDVRRPPADMQVTNPTTPLSARSILTAASEGGGGADRVEAVLRMNPDYEALVLAGARWRRLWADLPAAPLPSGPAVHPDQKDHRIPQLRLRLGVKPSPGSQDRLDEVLAARLSAFQTWHGLKPTGVLDDRTVEALNRPIEAYEAAILASLDQLRVLPAQPDRRALVVDIAAAELTALENGQEVGRMRVVVGRPETPTPSMAGTLRYAVLTPYWNLPHDLVRDRIAPEVLRRGPSALDARRMEALSDWSPQARRLEPANIDWAAVAAGETRLRVRQSPGPANMMGRAKFIFPNTLGIYLHDTPDKGLFHEAGRQFSAGCVRVEDAAWLGRWLSGRDLSALRTGEPEQKAALADPVPVYLLYLTVKPRRKRGLEFGADPYGRLGQGWPVPVKHADEGRVGRRTQQEKSASGRS